MRIFLLVKFIFSTLSERTAMLRKESILALCILLFTVISSSLAQAPPQNLEGQYHGGANELNWNHPESGTQPVYYKIYRGLNLDPSFAFLASTTHSEFADNAIMLNMLYHYRVTAIYPDSTESAPSNIVNIFTHADFSGLRPPKNLEGHFHDNLISLRWRHPESPANPTLYKIYRSTGEQLPAFLASTPETTYDDNSIVLNTRYHYAVSAVYNDTSESFPSNFITVFTGIDSTHDSSHVRIWFTTEPKHFAVVNQPYQYDPDVATMPSGIPVCFRLGNDAPNGMTIDNATGLIQWTPTSAGIFEVEINAKPCDGSRGEAEQEFHILALSGKPGSVTGIVQDTAGAGLPNVIVKLFDVARGEFVMRTMTDNGGNYNFPMVNPTTYYVRAKPENKSFAPQWYNGAARIDDATAVVVPESTTVTVNFTLHGQSNVITRFNLSGTVMDASSQPIGGARVTVFGVEHDNIHTGLHENDHPEHDVVQTTITDSSGHYHFLLRGGTFVLSARAEHFLPQFWNHQPTPLDANRLKLTQDTAGIDFNLNARMTGIGSISGLIRNAADSSALESHVVGFQQDSTGHFTGFAVFSHTDSTGMYTLDHLPNGSYIVLAKSEHEFIPTFYSASGSTPFLDSATAVGVNGSSVTSIDIYVRPDSDDGLNSIAGFVETGSSNNGFAVDAASQLGGAIVTITDNNHRTAASVVSESDGNYLAPGLAPGSYTVIFQKAGMTTASIPVSVSYVNSTPTMTTVNAQLSGGSGTGQIGTMNVRAAWNLVSVPVTVADAHRNALFPNSISNAFHFDAAAGYQPAEMLNYTSGYWLKFPAVQIFNLAGAERTSQTISVDAGWNLIGSISTPVAVSSLQQNQPNLIAANIFGYNGGYSIATTLEPGKGYWVKAATTGSLTLNAAANAGKSTSLLVNKLSELNTLTIKDMKGNTQVLYFGSATGRAQIANIDLPPIAPESIFDVRFASQRLAELHPASIQRELSFPISLQAAQGPLSVSWSVKNAQTNYRLTDGTGKSITPSSLTGNGTVQISGSDISKLILSAQPSELPKQIALYQNYPNPFNPTTTIAFDLPISANVTLKVYNIIGQEVQTLLNGTMLEAGAQSISFDASKLASGMYFYKLQTGTFTSVKKMLLLK
jgi:fibronectin type 3 domain-containing protein